MNKFTFTTKGFTLVELILVMGMFAFITALLMQNLFSIYRYREVIRYKKEINLEASLVLNNGIAGLIRSGFGIDYDHTTFNVSNYLNSTDKPDGMRADVDQLAVFMDRPGVKNDAGGRRYFTIHREAYQDSADIARLMITFYNGDEKIEAKPLHSSEVVVEEFDVIVPKKPTTPEEADLHPYVQLYWRVRHRYPYGDNSSVDELEAYQNVRASYQTTFMLRNVPQ